MQLFVLCWCVFCFCHYFRLGRHCDFFHTRECLGNYSVALFICKQNLAWCSIMQVRLDNRQHPKCFQDVRWTFFSNIRKVNLKFRSNGIFSFTLKNVVGCLLKLWTLVYAFILLHRCCHNSMNGGWLQDLERLLVIPANL